MLLPWDRLNLLRTQIQALTINYEYRGEKHRHIQRRECEDLILEFLIDCYLLGIADAREQLGSADMTDPSTDDMYETIYRKIEGKTFADRVRDYAETGDEEAIMRVAATDGHRVFNDSSLNTAVKVGATEKTWNCMFVNSRDTHMYLHGTTVPIDAEFYTFKGNHAQYPGQFGVAEEDVNCNCWLTFR